MSEETQPLIGEQKTLFKFGKPEDFQASIDAARIEQEALCGYPLVLKSTRQTHFHDEKGADVYEVYATFAPAPVEVIPADATQV